MSTKNPKESIVEVKEDGEIKELYLATNPFGNFVVEFELLLSELSELNESKSWKYKFRMFNVDKLEKDDYSNLKASKALSYRKLSEICTSQTFEFTTTQSDLISSENKLNWSVAVSNRLFKKKAHKSIARLLAISCISKNDMTYKDPKDPKDPNDTSGFTIVFFIDQEDYSIKKILTLNNCGGKVKLFSKYKVPAKTDNNSQNTDKQNTNDDNQNTDNKKTKEDQTLDKFSLIIFNAYGIHKYHFKHLNINVTTGKIRSLKYPKRIYNALNKNKKFGPEFNQKYIQKCLNLHYFLVDTTYEGAKYMELYDIRTNQLVNTFKRQNLNSLNLIADIPDCVAISHNNKLLAYASGNYVKLYSIDCGLEIASIEIIKKVKESGADYYDDYFMHFFNDDENLLIYQSINQWATWNIFGLEQKSIELKDHHLEFDLKMLNIFSNNNCYHLERANSFVIIVKNKEVNKEAKFSKERYIYDGFISDYLKIENVNPNFKTLSLTESFAEKTIEKEKYFIFDLEHKKSELDDYYHILEPWLYTSDVKATPRYSVYLDKKNETLLLIGNHTIQVWHDRAKKDQAKQDPDKNRTLEFISVIDKEENNNISIEKIEYTIRKFKISFKDSKDEIEMGCDDDIIHTVIEACDTLKFLSSIYHGSDIAYSISLALKNCHSKFLEIFKQTRNIIIRFIQLYPIVWRLLGVRYDLLGILIEAKEKQLIRHILFNEKKDIDSPEDSIRKTLDYLVYKLEKNEHSNDKMSDHGPLLHEKSIHMPQYSSWFGKDNTIHRAFKNDDPIYLGYLLEYYSNKAVEDIGWMISVGEILPMLYNKSCKDGMLKSYLQILLYKPCFCSKALDIPYFDFLTIPPSINNSLEVFIPITQLIPLDSDLKVEEISKEKIPDVQIVPFIDFATNNKTFLEIKGNKYINFLKSLIFPNQFLSLKDIPIPILCIIELVESDHDDPFYFNPSTEAIMNFMWHASKSHWFYTLYIFIIYFLSYSILTWMYVAHIEVTGDFQLILTFVTIILFFYLNYYHFIVEFNQARSKSWDYLKDPFNFVDLFSLILPFIISVYILLEYYTIEDGFKYAESNVYLSFIIFISIIVIWYEFIVLLRIFPGFAHYLDILYNIVVEIRLFLLFFALTVIGMGHALFIFLGYAAYIGLSESPMTYEITNGSNGFNLTEGKPENIFSNPFSSIISAYNWDSTALDAWGFWPLIIISVLGNIVFIIILQNVIISFMSAAFESADKDGKRTVLNFQSRLIYDYARLENSAFTSGKSDFDNKLKNKLRVKYVCFYDEPSITKAWRDEAKEWETTPIYWNAESQVSTEDECKFFMDHEDIRFIWISKKHHERRDSII
ncbi:transient receptor potential channel pyrexia-like [Gigaspora margarita]|uniref:Transient receptor potential channel pyrexia-like n=1 Tax=Gigaspora margarita TaxID=4874 RepID=A0A8H4ANA4_GIGMA|nr:transient receptor potential channel pyrexia-like [Gigaspora margarita]